MAVRLRVKFYSRLELTPFLQYAGFFVNLASIPAVLRWLQVRRSRFLLV